MINKLMSEIVQAVLMACLVGMPWAVYFAYVMKP